VRAKQRPYREFLGNGLRAIEANACGDWSAGLLIGASETLIVEAGTRPQMWRVHVCPSSRERIPGPPALIDLPGAAIGRHASWKVKLRTVDSQIGLGIGVVVIYQLKCTVSQITCHAAKPFERINFRS
jgi:hypothetical protein